MLWHHLIHLVARKHLRRGGSGTDPSAGDASPARKVGADRIIAVVFLLVVVATLAVLSVGALGTVEPPPSSP